MVCEKDIGVKCIHPCGCETFFIVSARLDTTFPNESSIISIEPDFTQTKLCDKHKKNECDIVCNDEELTKLSLIVAITENPERFIKHDEPFILEIE